MRGYIKLPRAFFESWMWNYSDVSYATAYLDLHQLAAFAPTRRIVKSKLISLEVGELVASERFLEKRWNWSRTKVRNFIKNLETDQQLDRRKDQQETILILRAVRDNGNDRATKRTSNQTKKETSNQTKGVPRAYQGRTKLEEGKEGKEGKEEKKSKKTIASALLPFSSPSFLETWNAWEKHRVEIRKKLTPSTAQRQLKRLGEMAECDAIATINLSIDNGWQGLFPERFQTQPERSESAPDIGGRTMMISKASTLTSLDDDGN